MPGRRLHLDKSASTILRVGEKQEVGPWAANTATEHLSTILTPAAAGRIS
jgi:hypothetical protein